MQIHHYFLLEKCENLTFFQQKITADLQYLHFKYYRNVKDCNPRDKYVLYVRAL